MRLLLLIKFQLYTIDTFYSSKSENFHEILYENTIYFSTMHIIFSGTLSSIWLANFSGDSIRALVMCWRLVIGMTSMALPFMLFSSSRFPTACRDDTRGDDLSGSMFFCFLTRYNSMLRFSLQVTTFLPSSHLSLHCSCTHWSCSPSKLKCEIE